MTPKAKPKKQTKRYVAEIVIEVSAGSDSLLDRPPTKKAIRERLSEVLSEYRTIHWNAARVRSVDLE